MYFKFYLQKISKEWLAYGFYRCDKKNHRGVLSTNYWICPHLVYIEIFLKTYLKNSGSLQFFIMLHFDTFLIQCDP